MNPKETLGKAVMGLTALSLVNLMGCDLLSVANDLDGSPTVAAQVMFVEVPYDNLGQVADNMPSSGATITVSLMEGEENYSDFLAGDMLAGARVSLWHPNLGMNETIPIPAVPDHPGVYALNNLQDDRLRYLPGANFRVTIQLNGEDYEICQVVPDITTFTDAPMFGEYISGEENVRVSWSPAETNAFVAVTNSSGELVHYTMPGTTEELYEWLDVNAAATASIPAESFDETDTYAIAVAALRQAEWGQEQDQLAYLSENLSPVGSFFLAGSAAVTAVSSEPLEFVSATIVETSDDYGDSIRVDVSASEFDIREYMEGVEQQQPLTYETVWLEQPDGQRIDLVELVDDTGHRLGTYVPAEDTRGLLYFPEEDYRISLQDASGRIRYLTASVASGLGMLDLEEEQALQAGEALSLQWTEPVREVSLRVVNEYLDVVYEEKLSGEGEALFGAEVPGEVFEGGAGHYIVEVLGLSDTKQFGDSYGLNLAYSDFVSGKKEHVFVEVMSP